MANKTYKVTVRYPGTGQQAEQVLIEANNPPQAIQRAEMRYGGVAGGANQVF